MSTEKNYWHDDQCAKAFWDQKNGGPYQGLVRDTFTHVRTTPGESWLDLGCGSGQLTSTLWHLSGGQLKRIVAADCAAVNAEAIAEIRRSAQPVVADSQIQFQQVDFSHGLPQFKSAEFDGVISGLAISYAESQDPKTGKYNDHAYQQLLSEISRVLKPNGKFVFSVNVPEPGFWKVFFRSLRGGHRVAHARRVLVNAVRMQVYGHWLKKQARKGRFHFYPIEELTARLARAGLHVASHQISYVGQAYVVSSVKSTQSAIRAA